MSSKYNKLKMWKGPITNKLGGFLLFLGGLITIIAGFGAWKNPHLDWNGFREALFEMGFWSINEVARLIGDPFAFIGLILMIIGILAATNGLKKLLGISL